jgi:carboxypeptidase PM20D1
MLRTTTAVTLFRAGVKENVLPIEATAAVNFRIHPRDSIEVVTKHVRETIADERIRLQVGLRTPPRQPSPVSPLDAPSWTGFSRTIRSVFPDAVVVPYLVVGGTDARHYGIVTENIYRFEPYVLGAEATRMAHGTNERMTAENLGRAVRFYRQLLLDGAGPAQPSSE